MKRNSSFKGLIANQSFFYAKKGADMEHIHNIYDTDARFVINPITREIKNISNKKNVLIQGDHNSERYTFELPRYIEGHDMSLCTKVEVHYFNIDSKTKEARSGIYEADDLQVSKDDESIVLCSWVVSGNSTKFHGELNFLLRYVCVNYAWNTAFYKGLSVAEGSDAAESFAGMYVDIIEQWKSSVMEILLADLNTWKEQKKGELEQDIDSKFNERSAEWNQALAVERARIDQFTSLKEGSATGDAELMDIRVGADGKTYGSAGEAVREQINVVKMSTEVDLHEIQSGIIVLKEYEKSPFITNGNISTSDGSIVDGTRAVTDFIEPKEGHNIRVRSLNGANIRGVRYNTDDSMSAFLSWKSDHTIEYSEVYKYRFMSEDNVNLNTANNLYQIFYESTKEHDVPTIQQTSEYNRMSRTFRLVLPSDDKWYFEKDADTDNVYIKAEPYLLVRGKGDATKAWNTILEEVGESNVATSPSGVTNCVKLTKGFGLYFDMSTNTFVVGSISFTTDAKFSMVVLNWDGKIASGSIIDSISVYAYDIANNNSDRINAIESMETILSLPDNIETSILTGVDTITYGNADAVTFGLITDIHANYNAYKYAAEVAKYRQLEFMVVNGDLNWAGSNDEKGENSFSGTKKEMLKTAKALSAIGLYTKVLPARGNHDGVLGSQEYTSKLFADAVIRPFTECEDDGWYYYDDEKNKIRIIVMNSCDDPSARRGFSSDEVAWLNEVLNNTPSGYSVITASHHPLQNDISENIPVRASEVVAILEAFKESRADDYICHLYGHTHADKIETINGVVYISTTASDTLSSNFAMDCFCIDKANKTVNVVRIGDAGENRSFNY